MKRPSLRSTGIIGLFFGLLFGIWLSAGSNPPDTARASSPTTTPEVLNPQVITSETPEADIAGSPTWTYRGEAAHLEIPLDFEVGDEEVETAFGYQTDFFSPEGRLVFETAPGFGEASITLRELAQRFALSKSSRVEKRQVANILVYLIPWTEESQPSTQYFFTKDKMTYGLRSSAGSSSDQRALLDFLVDSVERNEPSGAATPTATPTPTPRNERPSDCVGKDAIPKTITNVEKFANTRDRPSPDAAVATRLPVGTAVTWTGEKIKNGRFVWHEIYSPELDHCVWIAHGLIGERSEADTPSVLSEPLVFGPSSIAGLPIGSSTEAIVDRITAIAGPSKATSQVPADSYWGPGGLNCPSYLWWDHFLIVTCNDGTTAGWLAETNAPPEFQIDVGDGDVILHWRRLENWPEDAVAWFEPAGEFWVIESESLGLAGVVDRNAKALFDTNEAVWATEVFSSNTVINEMWNSNFGD